MEDEKEARETAGRHKRLEGRKKWEVENKEEGTKERRKREGQKRMEEKVRGRK